MKRLFTLVTTIVMACAFTMAENTNKQKQIRKERQEISKLAKKDLNSRVDKTTQKEAKRLRKEGWDVKPGMLPLEKQLQKSYLMEFEYDENAYPKYIMGSASSVGEHYDAARTAAMSLAITNLAGQIQTEVTALVENTVANKQLSADEAASISETVMSSKNLISQSIGRVITVVECYRINEKKNNEVLVRVAYSGDLAKEAVRKVVRQVLEEKGIDLHEQLDRVLGF